jgi:hypothetical protein
MTLSIMTLSIMTLSIMTLSIMILSIMTLSTMTLSIIQLIATLTIRVENSDLTTFMLYPISYRAPQREQTYTSRALRVPDLIKSLKAKKA